MRVTEVDGVPELTSLRIELGKELRFQDESGHLVHVAAVEPSADTIITTDRLRRLPLALLARQAAAIAAGDEDEAVRGHDATRDSWPQGRRRPDSHYEEVAEVYRRALRAKLPPTKAVQDRWKVGRAMASKYVKEARERGLLGDPSRPGVAGDKPPASKKRSKKGT